MSINRRRHDSMGRRTDNNDIKGRASNRRRNRTRPRPLPNNYLRRQRDINAQRAKRTQPLPIYKQPLQQTQAIYSRDIRNIMVSGRNPREMANQILAIPGAERALSDSGLSVEDIYNNVDVAVGGQMGFHEVRSPGCDIGAFGACNGSGGCIGLGCIGSCSVSSHQIQMNWDFGGSMSGGGTWSGHLDYQWSGGTVSVNCNFGFTF